MLKYAAELGYQNVKAKIKIFHIEYGVCSLLFIIECGFFIYTVPAAGFCA